MRTDHRPIVTKFYSNTRAASPRQELFFDFISQMTNKVEHVDEKENVADIFSCPISPHPHLNAILPSPGATGIDYIKIAAEQRNDSMLESLR